jgi:hypothetical protein
MPAILEGHCRYAYVGMLRHCDGADTGCDTTIKTLYGKQEGAVGSDNPHQRGRSSHAIHAYWIANLRLVLHAQLEPGDRHIPAHGRPGLLARLESLPPGHRPTLVRGDIAFGSKGEMSALENIGLPHPVQAAAKRQGQEAGGAALDAQRVV